VVIGFMTHRLNVVITAREYADPVNYFPSWMEVVVSYGLIAAGFIATGLAIKAFPTLREPEAAGAQRGNG
jgi:Ni/Fe-hydrogenase subunit HybB-like protein